MTKTLINHRFRLQNSFQEILYLTDNWINEGSGWIVQSIESQYINILTYRSLSRSSYMNLPVELRNRRKGLINIKKNEQKHFYGVMLGILIPEKNNLEELKQPTKKLLKNLIIMKLRFLCKKNVLARLR